MIGYILHKLKLLKLKREKELLQAECIHDYSFLGEFVRYVDLRVEVVGEDYYKVKCTKCGHEKYFDRKSEALHYVNFNK